MSVPEPAVVDLQGEPLPMIIVLRTPCAQMNVRVGKHLFEVLSNEPDTNAGLVSVVLTYNENTVPTGAVKQQLFVADLSPWVTIRVDGSNVFHIREHHPAMQEVMILDQTADGGLKWVPLLGVERNGQMLTARFGNPFDPSNIDIAI